MLTLKIASKPKIDLAELEKISLYDLVQDDSDLEICFSGNIFFKNSVAIHELAQCCQKWLKRPKEDFVYNTIESEENPLLAFRKQKNGWRIESVWQIFECNKVFSAEDVTDFINNLISHVAFDFN